MRSKGGVFIVLAMVVALAVAGLEALAAEPLRVYSVKNTAAEVEKLGAAFTARNPDTPVVVTGGVPEAGFASFAAGHYDILVCPQGQVHETRLSAGKGFQLAHAPVGSYGMAIVVSPSLAISELTIADVRKLYSGECTNWAQLGGPNEPTKVYSREPNAGATVYMRTKLLGGANMAATVRVLTLDKQILEEISKSTGSVGYVRVNRIGGANLKVVALKKEANSPGVMPSEANVRNGSYPLTVILEAHWNGLSNRISSIGSFVDFCKENDLGLK